MHDLDFDHYHELGITEDEAAAIAQLIEEQDTLELLTIGIDIGSSTSHLLFAKVVLRRRTTDLSSRFEVVDRQVVWTSSIIHTPFREDGMIDAHELSHFIADAYSAAGLTAADVDSGAVILTGEAIKRPNARAIDELFASQSGKFVCASAGHELESLLAAHGSGATGLARRRGETGLHVDIGGGTTKLALIDAGEVLDVAAFAVGGRLLAQDGTGAWARIDDSARLVADDLGVELTPQTAADPEVRRRICERLAQVAVDEILGAEPDALGKSLELTTRIDRTATPAYLTFSGGVSEYVFGHETGDYGDIAPELAAQVVRQLGERADIPAIDAGQRIRATVIGASQYTVQVSGKTIHISDPSVLPVHNLPVVHLGKVDSATADRETIAAAVRRGAEMRGVDLADPIAIGFGWEGLPAYAALEQLALGIQDAAGGVVRAAHARDRR
ncbi:ethanolamine ammonia-lyase reactivating factor EutA [Nocardioides panacis]|uniref:Ethanolamine ammonia-lyase reactivating factor EutA n=1 Tax=Nocardioides panacis TaxID=2849501 RepID=A0A975Y239_9ACTN|nr:ethanolamine ammonia-lyase reactivating factor EutA [Nocardioides panacis]